MCKTVIQYGTFVSVNLLICSLVEEYNFIPEMCCWGDSNSCQRLPSCNDWMKPPMDTALLCGLMRAVWWQVKNMISSRALVDTDVQPPLQRQEIRFSIHEIDPILLWSYYVNSTFDQEK